MRDWADRGADRQGRHGARPNAAGLRLPQRRAGGRAATASRTRSGPRRAAAAFDRATFLDAGGFDERLFAYWEDVDLVLRLRSTGCAAGSPRTRRRPRALRDARLGLGAEELPDRLRARLRVAKVGGGEPPAAPGGAGPGAGAPAPARRSSTATSAGSAAESGVTSRPRGASATRPTSKTSGAARGRSRRCAGARAGARGCAPGHQAGGRADR